MEYRIKSSQCCVIDDNECAILPVQCRSNYIKIGYLDCLDKIQHVFNRAIIVLKECEERNDIDEIILEFNIKKIKMT